MTSHHGQPTTAEQEIDLLDRIPAPRTPPDADAPTAWTAAPRSTPPARDDAPPTYPVLGIEIAAISHEEAVEKVLEYARSRRSRQVHLCNAYTLTLAQRDEDLAQALGTADLNLPDGAPVAWLGRRAGTAGPVRGPALAMDVFLAGVPREGRPGVRHFLFGGAEGVADAMATALHARDDGIEIVGAETPRSCPLPAAELAALAHRINSSGADVVWIGLGTPRQDHMVATLSPLVTATLVPIGAAFDFISGRVAEAPAFLHGSGFEWTYRLLREPRRLWRRYLVDGTRFVMLLARHHQWAARPKS